MHDFIGEVRLYDCLLLSPAVVRLHVVSRHPYVDMSGDVRLMRSGWLLNSGTISGRLSSVLG